MGKLFDYLPSRCLIRKYKQRKWFRKMFWTQFTIGTGVAFSWIAVLCIFGVI